MLISCPTPVIKQQSICLKNCECPADVFEHLFQEREPVVVLMFTHFGHFAVRGLTKWVLPNNREDNSTCEPQNGKMFAHLSEGICHRAVLFITQINIRANNVDFL